ncbi:MAG: hypothetical protein R6V05_13255 [Candidatus Brocadiia bacterium]
MKVGKLIIVVVVLVVLAFLVWRFMPGIRQRAVSVYREHGGWTEAARQSDPVGFIEYAEEELGDDLAVLEETRVRMAEAEQDLSSELDRYRSLLESADELAAQFREAYRRAEAGDEYPVGVSGADYTEEELVEQVRLILLQRNGYEEIIADMQRAAEKLVEKRQELLTQTSATKAALSSLPAKKEIARVNELTGRTRELFQQVDDLIGQNEEMLAASPVRTVEELLAQEPEAAAETAGADVDARAFLEGSG